MGNIHIVTQVYPKFHKPGAVIKVKKEFEATIENEFVLWKARENVLIQRAKQSVLCPNINENNSQYIPDNSDIYLVVRSGSKYGYEEDFNYALHHFSHQLQDACFFIEDEYLRYVRKYAIANGQFTYENVVAKDGSLIKYYKKTYPNDNDTIFTLLKYRAVEHENLLEYDFTNAIQFCKAALKIKPDDFTLLSIMGRALTYAGKFDQAGQVLDKALASKRKLLPPKQNDFECRLIYHAMAFNSLKMKNFQDGLEYAKIANQIIPSWGDYRPLECMGFALMAMGENLGAIKCFDKILKESSKHSDIAFAFYNKACALSNLKKWKPAAASLAAAFMLEPFQLPKEAAKDEALQPLLSKQETKKILGDSFEKLRQFLK